MIGISCIAMFEENIILLNYYCFYQLLFFVTTSNVVHPIILTDGLESAKNAECWRQCIEGMENVDTAIRTKLARNIIFYTVSYTTKQIQMTPTFYFPFLGHTSTVYHLKAII